VADPAAPPTAEVTVDPAPEREGEEKEGLIRGKLGQERESDPKKLRGGENIPPAAEVADPATPPAPLVAEEAAPPTAPVPEEAPDCAAPAALDEAEAAMLDADPAMLEAFGVAEAPADWTEADGRRRKQGE
jgi:hypothetical protein